MEVNCLMGGLKVLVRHKNFNLRLGRKGVYHATQCSLKKISNKTIQTNFNQEIL